MPHMPATHLTITPKHVYINGEPIIVTGDGIKLSDPNPTEVQTATLTICPTSVTILNDDDSNLVNAAHEAHTCRERDEAVGTDQNNYLLNSTREAYDAWKRYESKRARREYNADNEPEERSGLSEICEEYRKTHKKPTLTTIKQHEWMNEFKNRR